MKHPRVQFQKGAHKRVRFGHPWAFSNEIQMDPATKALPAGSIVTLTDAGGGGFLSNRPEWKYHSLQALSAPVQRELEGTHQYADLPITPVSTLPPALRGIQPQRHSPVTPPSWAGAIWMTTV